ncbi:Theileria-specific sub-telomeric protein, SVSP family, putative [Theileria annulata]|uniref:Theileria-specific sub-telomeric protein, SVSP family, putative n=1 Tax=Theileria annulata TaxID=5874 RepID=Q4UD55_THEAN|nr:Theileria-specific sub-telomeric protein, SVSP family, putative [Theileria annulata]CAI75246.1 Theileria-specific sub-telomeric protein, SVSP family, putative [Theileria annulata]|eukprot:XP_954722.1 Theileria-specific sub-telomeric protein, SVSP family, putative [Theileria annulata]
MKSYRLIIHVLIFLLIGYSGCSDKPTNTQGSNSSEDNLPKIGGLSLVDYSDSDDEDNFQVTTTSETTQTETITEETTDGQTETQNEPVKDVGIQTETEPHQYQPHVPYQPTQQPQQPQYGYQPIPYQPVHYQPQPVYQQGYQYPEYGQYQPIPQPYTAYEQYTQPTPPGYTGYEPPQGYQPQPVYQPYQPPQPQQQPYYPGYGPEQYQPYPPAPYVQYPQPTQPYGPQTEFTQPHGPYQPQPPQYQPHEPQQSHSSRKKYQQHKPRYAETIPRFSNLQLRTRGQHTKPRYTTTEPPTQSRQPIHILKRPGQGTQTTTQEPTQPTTEPAGLQPETIPVEVGSDDDEDQGEDEPPGDGEGEDNEKEKKPKKIKKCKDIKFLKKDNYGNAIPMTEKDYEIVYENDYSVKYIFKPTLDEVLCDGESVYKHRVRNRRTSSLIYNKMRHNFILENVEGMYVCNYKNNFWKVFRHKFLPMVHLYTKDSYGNVMKLSSENYTIEIGDKGSYKFTIKDGVKCSKITLSKHLVWEKKNNEDYPICFYINLKYEFYILFKDYIYKYTRRGNVYMPAHPITSDQLKKEN